MVCKYSTIKKGLSRITVGLIFNSAAVQRFSVNKVCFVWACQTCPPNTFWAYFLIYFHWNRKYAKCHNNTIFRTFWFYEVYLKWWWCYNNYIDLFQCIWLYSLYLDTCSRSSSTQTAATAWPVSLAQVTGLNPLSWECTMTSQVLPEG